MTGRRLKTGWASAKGKDVRLELSSESQRDIDDIHRYGVTQFGFKQADAYSTGLLDLLNLLESNPFMAVELSGFKQRYRMLRYQSHLVFYRVGRGRLVVVRICHGRSNWREHLK
jgi:toxin ParE1/3/4